MFFINGYKINVFRRAQFVSDSIKSESTRMKRITVWVKITLNKLVIDRQSLRMSSLIFHLSHYIYQLTNNQLLGGAVVGDHDSFGTRLCYNIRTCLRTLVQCVKVFGFVLHLKTQFENCKETTYTFTIIRRTVREVARASISKYDFGI